MVKKQKTPTIKEQEILIGELGLKRYHKKIEKILRKFIDMKEEYYSIISLWIVGTYLHKQFSSYPYLFFNAMKGSGKTRMLNIISMLSKNGRNAGSMTEAVLFRTAYKRTLCLDEIEKIDKNEALNLILNSAYKKGLSVERMAKKKTQEGEIQEPESFNVYCPIAMANIKGIRDVLADRCISIILEKSSDKKITRLIENFEHDIEFQKIRGGLKSLTENFPDDLNYFGDVIDAWNSFVEQDTYDTYDTYDGKDRYKELFQKMDKIGIEGRNLELFFPLFITADICGNKILNDLIDFSKGIIKERRHQDKEENKDVQIYDFVSQYPNREFVFMADLIKEYREFIGVGVEDTWTNSNWLGKRLRILNLVLEDRRQRRRSVRLDIDRAIKQFKMWDEPSFEQELKEGL